MKISKKRLAVCWILIGLAVLCILYGIRVMCLGYGSVFFIVWMFLALVLLLLSFATYKKFWSKIPLWLRRTVIAVLSVCLVFFLAVEGLVLSQVNAKGEKDLDYIIVLGAMVTEDGPSSILKARLNAAVDYLEQNPDTKVIVSGGQGTNEPWSEAQGMRDYLVEQGIDDSRILLESESFNTVENIQNSMKLIDDENAKVGIATSSFHVFRACAIARKQGLKNVSGIVGKVVAFYMPQNMFRECFGIVKDKLVGNM